MEETRLGEHDVARDARAAVLHVVPDATSGVWDQHLVFEHRNCRRHQKKSAHH
jgi:hypothetical protein